MGTRSSRSLRVGLVALLAALAAGCGDGDGAAPSAPETTAPTATETAGTSPSTTSNEQARTRPTTGRKRDSSKGTSTQQTPSKGGEPSKRAQSTPDSRRVERYLRDNFGGAGAEAKSAWYDHVVEIVVSGTTTTVRTDLSDDRSGRRQASQICLDVRGSIPGITDTVRVTELAAETTLGKCVP